MKIAANRQFMLNVKPVEDALEGVLAADPVEYAPMDALDTRRRYGLSAESIEKAFPFAVETDGMGMKYINYEALVPVLFKAIAELSAAKRRTTKNAAQ